MYTSAKNSSGIEELFNKIGSKVLNPNEDTSQKAVSKNEVKPDSKSVKLSESRVGPQKKKEGCC